MSEGFLNVPGVTADKLEDGCSTAVGGGRGGSGNGRKLVEVDGRVGLGKMGGAGGGVVHYSGGEEDGDGEVAVVVAENELP